MKSLFTTLTIFLSVILLMPSCSKDEGIADEDYYFEVSIDGREFRTAGLTAYATALTGSVNIFGADDLNFSENIYIQLPENFSEGTHTFDENTFGYYVINGTAYSTLAGGKGKVKIDHWDGIYIRGSFEMEVVNFDNSNDVVVMSSGKFDVKMR